MFPVYAGKCLSGKTVHDWVEKRDNRFADDEEVETEFRKWLRRTGKAMGHVYQCWWRICREMFFFFQFRISQVLRDQLTDCPPYKSFVMR
jgi:hypothetical protein